MTRLILVRHGQSAANRQKIYAGHTDVPLTKLGLQQAEAVARYLTTNERIDRIFSSDLTRAMCTAAPTAKALDLTITPMIELREIFAGNWENVSFHQILERYRTDWDMWITDLKHAGCTGGETLAQVYARILEVTTRLAEAHPNSTLLITSHWTPILCMMCHAEGYSFADLDKCPEPPNASIQILQYENGRFRTEEMNIVRHLDGLMGVTHP